MKRLSDYNKNNVGFLRVNKDNKPMLFAEEILNIIVKGTKISLKKDDELYQDIDNWLNDNNNVSDIKIVSPYDLNKEYDFNLPKDFKFEKVKFKDFVDTLYKYADDKEYKNYKQFGNLRIFFYKGCIYIEEHAKFYAFMILPK